MAKPSQDQAEVKIQRSFKGPDAQAGQLYLVPTPIGNLDDMTFRAVATLKAVDFIAAEDTRHTQKLLNHFAIDTKKISFHEHNTQSRLAELVDILQSGQSIAQVSDAGMPSISDPGMELVQAALDHGISVIPLPGANAGLTALIASGIPPQPFYFHGFLPRGKSQMKDCLQDLVNKRETLVFYESPHRLKKCLKAMNQVFGPNRYLVLGRELTKEYEEFIRGELKEILNYLETVPLRGEFVIIVAGNDDPQSRDQQDWQAYSLEDHVAKIMADQNVSSKAAIKEVAKIRQIPKRQVYAAYHDLDWP